MSQSANSPTRPPKGNTDYEKGEHYLRLSLAVANELDSWSKHTRLSASQKASYAEACRNARTLADETKKIRDQLSTQKRSFRKLLVNLFIRVPSTKRFYKVSYRNYSSIRRTSDDLNRQLLSEIDTLLTSGNLGESAQGNKIVNKKGLHNVVEDNLGLSPNENTQSINLGVQETQVTICEEDEENDSNSSPCDIVEGNHSAGGFSSNENTQDINIAVHTGQGVRKALEIIDQLGNNFSGEEHDEEEVDDDDDNDDDRTTIRPSHSQSRAPSPGPICNINIFINQSVVSFNSESTGTTLNVGVNEGVGSTLG
jgi:hypothetical protein